MVKPHSGISVPQIEDMILFYAEQLQCANAFLISPCAGLLALPVPVCGKRDANMISCTEAGLDQDACGKYFIILMWRDDKDIHCSIPDKS